MNWTPSPADIAWQTQLVAMLKNNARWGTSDGLFQIDKENRVVHLLQGDPNDECNQRVIAVFECMNYRCEKPPKHPWEK